MSIDMVCSVVCKYLSKEFHYAFLCLSELKAEFIASPEIIKKKSHEKHLKSKESVICNRLTLVIFRMLSLTKIVIPSGHCTKTFFKLLYHIYYTVNGMIKYFLVRSSYEEPVYKDALLSIFNNWAVFLLFLMFINSFVLDLENYLKLLTTY